MSYTEDDIQKLEDFFEKRRPLPDNILLDVGTRVLQTEKVHR
jgi:hypothetical protein